MARKTTISIETTEYENSHGKKPRGFGLWCFHVMDNSCGHSVAEIWMPTGMNYGLAKKTAKDEVQRLWTEELATGFLSLSVGS